MGRTSRASTTCLTVSLFPSPCSCRGLPGEERQLVHSEEDEARRPLGRAGAAAGGDGSGLLKPTPIPPPPPATLSSALCHPPPCSIKSGLYSSSSPLCSSAMTSAHRESDARGRDSGTKLFTPTTRRLCTPLFSISGPCSLYSFPSSFRPKTNPVLLCSEGPDGTPEHPEDGRPPWPGLLFVMAAVQRTFRAINNMYFDLAVHSS